MTSPEIISASHRSVYDTCDPDYLRQLRETSGVEETWLARTACLSLAQVRQLEEGGDSLFYSSTIKRQAYKRLLMILGAEPPSVVVDVVATPDPSVVHDLDEIIAMDEKNLEHRSMADLFQTVRSHLAQHKASALVVFMVGVTAAASLVIPIPGTEQTSVAERAPVKTPESLTLAALSVPAEPAASAPPVAQVPTLVSSTAESASISASVAATTSASVSASCQYTRDVLPQISPLAATKPSRYVHMVAAADVTVCVVDGNQQASLLKLKAGESQSVFGAAPWQVSSTKLAQLQIYFQGWRVALPEGTDQRVALIEKPN
jgi:cytoskeleton protein RodZ